MMMLGRDVVVVAEGSAHDVADVAVLMMMIVRNAVVAAALNGDVRKNAAASAVLLSVAVGSAVAVVMMMKDAACSVGAGIVAPAGSLEIGSADCRPLDTAAAVVG